MTGWLLSNMVWASAAMLLVLAIRRPFAALFGAGPVYALWLLPLLRLVAPPLPNLSAVELPNLIPPPTVILIAEDMAAPMPPEGGPGQWVPLLLAIWAAGVAAFLLWQIWTYHRFVRTLRRDARDLGRHRGLRLLESGAVEGPISLGLFRRRIVVPADFESRYSPEERALALDHEAIHHRRLDLWWNHLGLVILALNWFNPVAWFAFRAFRADQELACDAAVAARAEPDARHDYARALVKSASRPGLIAACPLNHADQLKRRLKMMKFHKPGRLRLLGGAAAIATLGGLSLAFGSAGAVAQPSPPAPPAPPSASAPRADDGERRAGRSCELRPLLHARAPFDQALGRVPSVTSTVIDLPFRLTVTSTVSPGLFVSTSRRSSSAEATAVWSNFVTTSPLCSPARDAGVLGRTSARRAPPLASSVATPR